jgi:hypothetical protein
MLGDRSKTGKHATWRNLRVIAALLALPMFAQCFQYMVDILPLYALSKAWPLLVLPLFFWAMINLDIPYKLLQIVTLFWILGVTPCIGIVQLGNDVIAALATTAKVWAYSFAFSAAAALVLLQLPLATLRRILLWLGVGTYVIMLLLWAVIPARAYGGGDAVSKLFMYDPERGYHIYMPMFFGILLIFYLNRSFFCQPRLWKLVAVALAFLLMLMIYKERVALAAAAGSVIIGAALSARRWRFAALSLLAVAAVAGALYMADRAYEASNLSQSLGGSLAVRRVSVSTAWTYLTADPLRWLLGVGATTRFGDVTLGRLFGNRSFFLTDIGWLGVIFEYGVIGALLMLLVHLAGLRAAMRWAQEDDALSQAFGDYIVYLIIASAIYSVVFTPGELTTIMALSYYVNRMSRQERSDQGKGASHPIRPMPRHSAFAKARPSGRLLLSGPSGVASSG